MQGIEDKIRKNLEAFNADEPEPGHFGRFGNKLDEFHAAKRENWFSRHDLTLKIAAAAVIFIALSVFMYTGGSGKFRSLLYSRIAAAELPEEVKEVMQYYNVITDQKVDKIDELAVSADEARRVRELAMNEIRRLDDARADLEQEYAKQPGNERIMNAILKNQQQKSEILDRILNTLNQVN